MSKKYLKLGLGFVCTIIALIVMITSFTSINDKGNQYKQKNIDVEKAFAHIAEISKAPHPRLSAAHDDVNAYIVKQIADYGFAPVKMEYMTTYQDVIDFGGYGEGHTLVPDTPVKNILVEIPGTKSDDILVIQAHYDSVPMGPGAYDDTISIASMLETLHYINENNLTFKNKIVFLFTDGEEEGLLGARMFANKRSPYNGAEAEQKANLMDDVKFVMNFEARGTGGGLVMFETTSGNANTIKEFASINSKVYTNSIANFVYQQMPNGTDYSAFSDKNVQGLNFANIGEGCNYHTQFDKLQNIDKSNIALVGDTMLNATKHFGDLNLQTLYATTQNAVWFSFLGLFTINYSVVAAYIIAVIIILIIAGIFLYNYKRKVFSGISVAKAIGINLIAIGASVVGALIIKAIFGTLFGITLNFNSPSYSSDALVYLYMTLFIAVFIMMQKVLKKLFKIIHNRDFYLAQTLFVAFLGIALSFAMPYLSFLLAIPALFASIVALVIVIRKDLYSYGLLVVPFLVAAPLFISVFVLANGALGIKMGIYTSILISLLVGFISPYILDGYEYIKQLIAKKEKKALDIVYRSSAPALTFLLVLIFAIIEGGAALGLSTNLTGKASGRSLLFMDDALIYHMNLNDNSFKYEIFEDQTYTYLKNKTDLKFEANENKLSYFVNIETRIAVTKTPTVEFVKNQDEKSYEIEIKRAFADSYFSLYFPKTGVSKVEINDINGSYAFADFSKMKNNQIKIRSNSDALVRIYVESAIEVLYDENTYFDMSEVTEVQTLLTKVPELRTGLMLSKTINLR